MSPNSDRFGATSFAQPRLSQSQALDSRSAARHGRAPAVSPPEIGTRARRIRPYGWRNRRKSIEGPHALSSTKSLWEGVLFSSVPTPGAPTFFERN